MATKATTTSDKFKFGQSPIGKVPPNNILVERSILGAVLLDQEAIVKVVDHLEPDDFYQMEHQAIFRRMIELFEKRRPIDVLTLTDVLEKNKELEEVGGATYLTDLVNATSSAAHIVEYSEIVEQAAVLRNLISAGSKIVELGFRESDELPSILDQAEQTLFNVSQKGLKPGFTPISEILTSTFERLDEIHKDKDKLRGIPTGFKDLDNKLAGLQNADLIILAARPAMGKSSLALSIASQAAIAEHHPVGIFSLEMSRDQLVDRLLVAQAGVDAWKLRTGNLSEEDFPKIGHAMGVLAEAPIFIDDSPILNVMEMRAKARRLQTEKGLKLLVVDYLQLIESHKVSREANRVQEISEISRALKALARELNIPVLALSQLSRAVEQRPDKRPQLADLRESGSIEQDSDVVMFIYREDYYKPETDRKNITEILIKKHRHGPVGEVELYFVPEQMKFASITKRAAS